jgi:hypothetical protein
LALDAFATAEQIDVAQSDLQDEVRRATGGTEEAASVEQLAMANPETRQRLQEITRERKAMARLLEVATVTDGATSSSEPEAEADAAAEGASEAEKDAPETSTSDTEGPSPDSETRTTSAGAEEPPTV